MYFDIYIEILLYILYIYIYRNHERYIYILYIHKLINMEPENVCVQKESPFQTLNFRFILKIPGCIYDPIKSLREESITGQGDVR